MCSLSVLVLYDSANFPVIAITLRENLRTLAHNMTGTQDAQRESATGVTRFIARNSYALFALVPPLIVAFFTEDVSMLVGYTGAYAGLGIQVRLCWLPWCRAMDEKLMESRVFE
jgi:hypothetical protein